MYDTPTIRILGLNNRPEANSSLVESVEVSITDVLGAIQQAYSDIGLLPERSGSVKRSLLELAARGEVDRLIYHAIVDGHRDG